MMRRIAHMAAPPERQCCLALHWRDLSSDQFTVPFVPTAIKSLP